MVPEARKGDERPHHQSCEKEEWNGQTAGLCVGGKTQTKEELAREAEVEKGKAKKLKRMLKQKELEQTEKTDHN